MEVSDWINLGSVIFAFLALVMTAMMWELSRRMAEANEKMAAANQDMAASAKEAVEVAREVAAMEQIKRAENLKACLRLIPQGQPYSLKTPSISISGYLIGWSRNGNLLFRIRNEGRFPAYDVQILHRNINLQSLVEKSIVIDPGAIEEIAIERMRMDSENTRWLQYFLGIYNDEKRDDIIKEWLRNDGKMDLEVRFRDGLGWDSVKCPVVVCRAADLSLDTANSKASKLMIIYDQSKIETSPLCGAPTSLPEISPDEK